MALTDDIQRLHKELRDLVFMSGFNPNRYDKLIHNLDSQSYCERLYEFLKSVQETEWQECNVIYTQDNMSPEMWKNYHLLGLMNSDLIEVKQIKPALKRLKDKMRTFKRGKHVTEEIAVQGGTGTQDSEGTDPVPN